MIPFQPGDHVKMTDRYAKTLMTSPRARQMCDWYKRRGVVYNANRTSVFIKWTDRRTLDQHPNGAIELDVNAT